ncbi:hypothetical protein RESH_03896 [Rhodopirellula europaea SH398]|uniref:Uncharacterized protein n=1 Tax=Rhodopirellula europaea SH398 TaxID=1263868 RepID=M5S1W6_9BACT|nr:hypothetical protein RESH_03896 [Rhodopirellula europaea SH398]
MTDPSNGSHRNNWHRNSSPQTRVWLGKIGKNRRGRFQGLTDGSGAHPGLMKILAGW